MFCFLPKSTAHQQTLNNLDSCTGAVCALLSAGVCLEEDIETATAGHAGKTRLEEALLLFLGQSFFLVIMEGKQ
jgi:hypothetical protein